MSPDVVVVGGGLPGLRAAARLRAAGVDALLVEARGDVGRGASGAGHGVAYAGLPEHPWRLVASLGAAEAGALLRFARRGVDALDQLGALERTGVVWAATEAVREPSEVARSVDALRALGLDATALDADAVAAATGVPKLGPGFRVADEGLVDLDAARAALRDAAGPLRLATRVTGLGADGDRLVVHTCEGAVRAHAVVLAAEAGLRDLHPLFADTLSLVREAAVVTRGGTLRGGLRAGFGWTVARPVRDGVLVAGCRWASPHLEEGEADDTAIHPGVQAKLEGFARDVLGADAVVESRAWIQAHGCDGLPLVGPLPDDPRVLVLGGFAGHEATLGLAAADAVVDGLLTGRADVPRCLSSFRFLP